MGHADRIVLADTNFPTASICGEGTEGPRQVRADGHSIPVLLEAILQLLPLDTYVYAPVMLMDLVNKDKNSGMPEPPVWATYQGLLDSSEGKKVHQPPFFSTNYPKFCRLFLTKSAFFVG